MKNNKFSVEYGLPLYQKVNGIQLSQHSTVTAGWVIFLLKNLTLNSFIHSLKTKNKIKNEKTNFNCNYRNCFNNDVNRKFV